MAIRADVVVYGKLIAPPKACPGCGPRIKAVRVIRGPKQRHFQLAPPDEPRISCWRRTDVIGETGVFGLVGKGPTYAQLYFTDRRPSDWSDKFQ